MEAQHPDGGISELMFILTPPPQASPVVVCLDSEVRLKLSGRKSRVERKCLGNTTEIARTTY